MVIKLFLYKLRNIITTIYLGLLCEYKSQYPYGCKLGQSMTVSWVSHIIYGLDLCLISWG
jgi:hypothetical protein